MTTKNEDEDNLKENVQDIDKDKNKWTIPKILTSDIRSKMISTMPPPLPRATAPPKQSQNNDKNNDHSISPFAGLPRVEKVTQISSNEKENAQGIQPIPRIFILADISIFKTTQAFSRIMSFIYELNESIVDKKVSDDILISENIHHIHHILDILDTWIDDIEPEETPQRFGNKAFRKWIERVQVRSETLHSKFIPTSSSIEILHYFTVSFGNATRIDYGSGHELNFLVYLLGLYRIRVFSNTDFPAIILRIFKKYFDLVRRLQKTYMLEPAGSHGVWGLDDYAFLPYIFGAAQLRNHTRIKPLHTAKKDMANTYGDEYLYFGAIRYIYEFKRGPFGEHSPLLNDIAHSVQSWQKVNQGTMKMYVAEVLSKVPIVQHLYFGQLIIPYEK